jgi:dienelactone hydrolase
MLEIIMNLNYKIGFWIVIILCATCTIVFLYKYSDFVSDRIFRIQNIIERSTHNNSLGYNHLPEHYILNLDVYHYLQNQKKDDSRIDYQIIDNLYMSNTDNFEIPNINTLADIKDLEDICKVDEYKKHKISVKDIDVNANPAVLQSSRTMDKYTLNIFTMKSFFDPEYITFYELLPSSNRDIYDAVFILPGTGNQGARDILGIPSEYSKRYYHDEIGKRIVEEGIAVYVIELRGTGTRQVNTDTICKTSDYTCSTNVLSNRLSVIGISLGDLQEAEIAQVLAWIEDVPYIDKIGTVGLSRGAGLAVNQAITNPDVIDAVVMASGIIHIENSPLNRQNSGQSILEDLFSCFDITYTGTIAPIPAYLSYGLEESELFRWEAEKGHVKSYLTQVYALHNASENLTYVVHNGSHQFDIPTVLKFLKTHLNTE